MAKVQTEQLQDFIYEGTNKRGEKVKGEATSRNIDLARAQLRKQGIQVKSIKKKAKPLFKGGKRLKRLILPSLCVS